MDEQDRQDIVDRLIGVGRPDLAKRYKHLSGKHDQRTHGWRYAKGGSDADRLSAARRSMRGTSAEQRATYRKRAGMPEARPLERKQPKPVDEGKAYSEIGRIWEKGNQRRAYLTRSVDDMIDMYDGLSIKRYNTGNVASARLDGSPISNGAAKSIINRLSGNQMYYDLNAGKLIFVDYAGKLSRDDRARLTVGARRRAGLPVD